MDRREFLRRVGSGGAVAASVAVAGCSSGDGNTGEPAPGDDSDDPLTPEITSVIVEDFGYEVTDDGTTEVTVSVVNEGDEERAVVVEAEVTADDEIRSDSEDVTLPAGESETLRFRFDVNLDEADHTEVAPSVRRA